MAGRVYGDAIANSLGLKDAPTITARSLRKSQIAVSGLSVGTTQMGMSSRIPPEDTFILALHLSDLPYHELWRGRRKAVAQGYAAGSMRIVNLQDEYSALITAPHEAIAFYIPRLALDEFTQEHDLMHVSNIACSPGVNDTVVVQLASLLLPALAHPDQADRIFVDHVTLALCAHLTSAYGGVHGKAGARRGLTPMQLKRAMDFMNHQIGGDISIADVAKQCGLSRGYFAESFRVATGDSPHRWLQRTRIDKAKSLLEKSNASIAEIASTCGFADQSHLTRVFSRLTGDSPAAWRRRAQD
jgi:AraC family transcriptional regulator